LQPTWNELAELLNTQDESRVRIAKVNCVENQKTCSENGVTGYPTLKFFKLGSEAVKYGMARDLPTLTSFINEQLDSTVAEKEEEPEIPEPQSGLVVLTDANFDELTATGHWFIKFYAPW
jgi:thioredoxin domain-containing protein 5